MTDRLADREGSVRAGDQHERRVQHAARLARHPWSRRTASRSCPTQAQADAAGKNFAAAVGCGRAPPTSSRACGTCRATTAAAETRPGVGYQDGGQGTVAPTINGTTLTMTLRQALASGHVNKVDVIAGTDRDEDLVGTATTAARTRAGRHAVWDVRFAGSGEVSAQPLRSPGRRLADGGGRLGHRLPVAADRAGPGVADADPRVRDRRQRHPAVRAPGTGRRRRQGASHVGAWFLTPSAPLWTPTSRSCRTRRSRTSPTFARNGNPNANGSPLAGVRAIRRGDGAHPAGDSAAMSSGQMSHP